MTGSGVDLHSGDILNVHMAYDGAMLTMTITDAITQQAFSARWLVDIPGAVGATTAYAGFTASTGGATAIQDILYWTFTPGGGQGPRLQQPRAPLAYPRSQDLRH